MSIPASTELAPPPAVDGPLSVLLVSEPAGGGVGQHVLDLAEGLASRGHRVVLAYGTARQAHGFEARVLRARQMGYHAVALPELVRRPGIADVTACRRLRESVTPLLAGWGLTQFDILHAHSTKAGLLARTLLRPLGRACVYTPHALYTLRPDLSRVARWVAATVERMLAWRTTRLVAVSRDEAVHAAGLGIAPWRIVTIENGIAPTPETDRAAARSRARSTLGIPLSAPVVGFVGRLGPQKAPAVAVAAMRHVLAAFPEAHAVVVGDDPDSTALAALHEPHPRLHWLPRGIGRDLVHGFDVLLCTSRYEGFPYVFLEALDAGVPLVSTPVGGSADCIVPGESGYIIPTPDPSHPSSAAAAATVAAILGSPSTLAALRVGARHRVQRFAISHMVDRLIALYTACAPPFARSLPPAPRSSAA